MRIISLAVVLLVAVGCDLTVNAGGKGSCGPMTCTGCCTADGQCKPGDTANACGPSGGLCDDCASTGRVCALSVCMSPGGTGGGTGTAGGEAGGTGSTAGGTGGTAGGSGGTAGGTGGTAGGTSGTAGGTSGTAGGTGSTAGGAGGTAGGTGGTAGGAVSRSIVVNTGGMSPALASGRQTWAIIGENRIVQSVPQSGSVTFTDPSLVGPQDITVVFRANTGFIQATTVVGFDGSSLNLPAAPPAQPATTAFTVNATVTGWSTFTNLDVSTSWATGASGSSSSWTLNAAPPVGTSAVDVYAWEHDVNGYTLRSALVKNVSNGASVSLNLVNLPTSDSVTVTNRTLYSSASGILYLQNGSYDRIVYSSGLKAISSASTAFGMPGTSGSYAGLMKVAHIYGGSCTTVPCTSAETTKALLSTSSSHGVELLPPVVVTAPALGPSSGAPTASVSGVTVSWMTPAPGQWIEAVYSIPGQYYWQFYAQPSVGQVRPFRLPSPLPAPPTGLHFVNARAQWTDTFTSFDALFAPGATGWKGSDERWAFHGGYVNLF